MVGWGYKLATGSPGGPFCREHPSHWSLPPSVECHLKETLAECVGSYWIYSWIGGPYRWHLIFRKMGAYRGERGQPLPPQPLPRRMAATWTKTDRGSQLCFFQCVSLDRGCELRCGARGNLEELHGFVPHHVSFKWSFCRVETAEPFISFISNLWLSSNPFIPFIPFISFISFISNDFIQLGRLCSSKWLELVMMHWINVAWKTMAHEGLDQRLRTEAGQKQNGIATWYPISSNINQMCWIVLRKHRDMAI